MTDIDSLLDLEPCGCGRLGCEFFTGSEGEWGASYSKDHIKSLLRQLPKVQKHLERLLKERTK